VRALPTGPGAGQQQVAGRCVGRSGQRRQGQAVHPRPVPAQPGAVRPAAPAGGPPGQATQPGQHRPDRCGKPRRRGGEPDGAVQQVHGEVGGERDRRLQPCVHGRGDQVHRGGPGGHRRGRGGGRRGGPRRPGAEPVHAQGSAPPGQVRAVGARAPGRGPVPGPARPRAGRHDGGGGRGPDRGGGRRDGELPCLAERDGQRRAGAEQPGTGGDRSGRRVGARHPRCLHRHGHRLPGSSCRSRGRDCGQGGTYGRRHPPTRSRDAPVRSRDRTVAGPPRSGRRPASRAGHLSTASPESAGQPGVGAVMTSAARATHRRVGASGGMGTWP
jgi:hypothetical protein